MPHDEALVKVAVPSLVPLRFVPAKVARVRLAPLRSVEVRLVPAKLALERFAPLRSVEDTFALAKLALERFNTYANLGGSLVVRWCIDTPKYGNYPINR